MLDDMKAALAPALLERELDDIAAAIAGLEAEREPLRFEAGTLVMRGMVDSRQEAEARRLHSRIADIDGQLRQLRDRRRAILDLLTPPSPVAVALVAVPRPADLVAVEREFFDARDRRRDLVAAVQTATGERAVAKAYAALADHETAIADLRRRRADLLEPYNREVEKALRPIVGAAAEGLAEAARAFREHLATLREAALIAPAVPGAIGGLSSAAAISTVPCRQAEALAAALLAHAEPAT